MEKTNKLKQTNKRASKQINQKISVQPSLADTMTLSSQLNGAEKTNLILLQFSWDTLHRNLSLAHEAFVLLVFVYFFV